MHEQKSKMPTHPVTSSPLHLVILSANRDRPQREACRGAADLVGHADVAKFVGAIVGEVFEEVELADVYSLLDEEIAVHGDETVGLIHRARTPFEAAGVGAEEDGAFLFDEPAGGGEVDAGRVMGADLLVIAAV